ncbi:hypothetical protein ACGFNU_40860 [Spirillospora sp. NPDC048911]|uniref:hypothetical protein n=1 Tax=Spirillospora sp. NPDC048911 TaxID=3364527 RepID=UPI00371BC6AB
MTPAEKRKVTFEEFWPIFQRHHRVEPNTMQQYFSVWINHIHPFLRAKHIATFDSTQAIKYFTALTETGRSVNTRKAARSTLSAMIGLSKQMNYRDDNPVSGLNVGKQAANKVINETVFWTMVSHLPLEPRSCSPNTSFRPGSDSVRPSPSRKATWTTTRACCPYVARPLRWPGSSIQLAAASSRASTPRTASTGASRSVAHSLRRSENMSGGMASNTAT